MRRGVQESRGARAFSPFLCIFQSRHRVRNSEKERNDLSKRRNAALEWLKLKNEHIIAKSRVLQWDIWKALQKVGKEEGELEELKGQLEELVNAHEDDVKHLEELRRHLEERKGTYEVGHVPWNYFFFYDHGRKSTLRCKTQKRTLGRRRNIKLGWRKR